MEEIGKDTAAQQRQKSSVKQWLQTNRLLKASKGKWKGVLEREREDRMKDAEGVETTKSKKTVLKTGRERELKTKSEGQSETGRVR